MHYRLSIALLAGLLAGCSNFPTEPDRMVFGVSGDRAAGETSPEADASMRSFLDARLNQICTQGYDPVKVDTLAAEENKQLVDLDARCKEYRFSLINSFDVTQWDVGNWF